ncbi:MAG TPA: sigma factor-like helix-turn-helix DNA-binding protein [Acidobacteriota bacterium]|nr:sigma factor-like helix-turn-helix DNA-binding protein [Acidobacteriota bacterium]
MDQVAWRDLSLGERLAGVLRRSQCLTVGELLRRGREWRLSRAGYGSHSEMELMRAVDWLKGEFDAGLDSLLMELSEEVASRPQRACRKIFLRRKAGGRWIRLLGHLAQKALQCVDLRQLRRHLLALSEEASEQETKEPSAVRDDSPGSESAAQGGGDVAPTMSSASRPADFFAPRPALTVHEKTAEPPLESLLHLREYPAMAEEKRELLQGAETAEWPGLEHDLFRLAGGVLPAPDWHPATALRLVPSWVLCRRMVESVAPLPLVRRARRCRWKTFAQALSEPARDLQPGFDSVGEQMLWEQVGRLVELGPGWPLSTSDLQVESTLQESFCASLERLPQRTARLMRLRMGAGRSRALTLQETARELNLSAERVRQIENAAWETLRRQEAWPRRLARKIEEAMEAEGTAVAVEVLAEDPWIGPRLTRSRPFFDQLVRKTVGSRRRLDMRYAPGG